MGVGEISFTFTQQQEGMFSCRRGGGGDESEKMGLAASPVDDYDGEERPRFITFETPESSRDINLSCPIGPGSLSERYRVKWVSSVPGVDGFIFLQNEYNITVSHSSSARDQYECQVTITHRIGQGVNEITRGYHGPMIVIKRNVLATIENDVQNVSIVEGESANFTCNFSKGDISDIDIDWTVDSDQYDECGTTEGDTDNGCYTTEGTQSMLLIRDTSSFSTGSHPVQCILQQNIPEDFKNDPSFQEHFNDVTSSALLLIAEPGVSTSTISTIVTTPTATATPNDPTSASGIGLAAGVGGSVGVILVAIFIVVFIIVFCCCIQRKSSDDPEGKGTRCFSWKPKEDVETGRYIRQPRESYAMTTPKIHVSQNEQFHAGDTPELRRQIAVPNGSRNHSLDPLEPIYNVSLNSGRSGESALSDSDSLSCPPSPAVSSIHEEDVSTSDSPYQPRPIISIGDERLGQYPDHHYFQQQVNQDQFLEQSRKYAPSQTSSLGIQNIFEGYPETGYGSQYDTHPAYHHSSCDPLSSLGVPLKEPRLGSTSSVHSDKTHSTRHSKGSSKSGKSSHSGRLDVEHEHLSQRMSPHHYDEHNRRHSPSSHHSDRYSDRYSDRHSDHHGDHHSDRHSDHHSDRNSDHLRSHSRSPRSHSPRAAMECAPHEAPQLSGYGQPNQYRSHHVLPIGHDYQAKGAPMRTTRSAEWARSSLFPPHPHEPENRQEQEPPPTETQHSDEPDAAPGEIIDEVLLMAVGCLMHQENCQIHKCPCKQVKKRFHNILPQTRLHMQKEADKVVEDAQSGNFDPSDRRQQMRISLSSQNFSKDIHAHYHMTSRSHIRPSDGRQRILQRRRSRSVDLTPVVEQPESCATTPGVVIPDGARGLLCGPMFSPAVTPAGEKFKVLSPTVPATNTVVPTVLLREISMSADNLPSLCLNDCPMAVTPMTQLGNRPLGYAMKSLSTTQCQWSADSADKPMPSAQEKESPSSDEGKVSDRYTSQDSSSSLQTTFTQSSGQSGKSEEISVFEDSGLQNRLYDAQTSTSTTSTEPEHSVRRKQYMVRGKQNEMTHEPDGILHLDSGYGTSGDATDGELSLQRSRLPPGDLPLSPPKIPAKQKNFALEQPKHLVPVANSNKRAQRSGSTSSHSSHASHLSTASVGSHVSQASDGSITTQTLC